MSARRPRWANVFECWPIFGTTVHYMLAALVNGSHENVGAPTL